MKKLNLTSIAAIVLLVTAACSPGHIAANNNGIDEYVWVGCHVVTEIPKNGSYVVYLLGDLKVGDNFYFKQVSNDGTVGPVITGKPCKQ